MRPPCPPEQNLRVLSGFSLPSTDSPYPRPLDGSVTAAVVDLTENNDLIRVVHTDDHFGVEVEWCICGPLAAEVQGCWTVRIYMDDIDGVAPFHGMLGSASVDVASGSAREVLGDSSDAARCYQHTFHVKPGTVGAGVYTLVAVITLATGTCADPGFVVGDTLGYAQIPVLMFIDSK
jgi:hypothetical protein